MEHDGGAPPDQGGDYNFRKGGSMGVASIGEGNLLETAEVHIPLVSRKGSNVHMWYGTLGALRSLLSSPGRETMFADPTSVLALARKATAVDMAGEGRGRKPGSTNWTRERFWRRYAKVAPNMRRPYRRTHLAARIGLSYQTFVHYLELWGPPQGHLAPGD